ncbi:hypothetical protein CDL15_Pgr012842 [Punica granatum]|uniref:RING-type domain-containing protein n=1 Tax=Punica granatum TaxID=22663 RepID=A0A218XFW0_PUNGR|nr:hypothetical protein CDL15_Pgr012842 [Punica granatum]
MSQLAMLLQESVESAGGLTILGLLRERMDGPDSRIGRRKSFTERIGLKGMGCCGGPIWGFQATTISVHDDDDNEEGQVRQEEEQEGDTEIHHQLPQQHQQDPEVTLQHGSELACTAESPTPVLGSMNLAAALAAERHYRASQEPEPTTAGGTTGNGGPNGSTGTEPGTPLRVSLMRLLEEADGGGDDEAAAAGSDSLCCVCMGRRKGAAFIPCGHTYCRVCSRELWLNRGSCPLCNRPILEILDIF